MKRNLSNSILFMIFGLLAIPAFSQYNPLTNDFSKMATGQPVAIPRTENLVSYDLTTGVPCTDNSFWAISGTGVDLFTMNGGIITKAGTTVISGSFDANLAYCNNLNGGAFSPTFYSTVSFHQPAYYDGTVAVAASTDASPNYIMNCAGYSNFLYYVMYDPSFVAKSIVRYDGSTLTSVYDFPSAVGITVADMAVDSTGNVWFFTGPNNGNYQSDTLKVVSSTGHMVKKFPFTYNTLNAYGVFLSHGKLYLGLGASNTLHPNTIVPLVLAASTVTPGTPMPMPVTTVYSDMASCATGAPFAVFEHPMLQGISVYPNPVTDKLTVNCTANGSLEISIYDITAREMLHQFFTGTVTLSTGQFPKGIYSYIIKNNAGAETAGKVVKE